MIDKVPWWQSKTIWVSLVGAAFAAAAAFGVLPEGLNQDQVIGGILAVTSVLAAVFRKSATTQIK